MSLKLPIFLDLKRTISSWAKELRGSGVIAVGRPSGPSVPYLPDGSQSWEQRTLGDVGERWRTFSPRLTTLAKASVTLTTINMCKYAKLARGIFYSMDVTVTVSGAGLGINVEFELPFRHSLIARATGSPFLRVGAAYVACAAFAGKDTAMGILISRGTTADYLQLAFPTSWTPWAGAEVLDIGCQFFVEAE